MFKQIKRFLTKSLYRRLILGITLIMAISMSLFAWTMTYRQESAEMRWLGIQALAIASSVASSSDVGVASRDISGLQEIVQGLAHYPDLRHVMVLDTGGQVLAHSDPSHRGQYLTDMALPVEPKILQDGPELMDVVSPIVLSGHHIGWVRLGLGRDHLEADLATTRRDAIFYTLLAIGLSALFAAMAARYLTRRLRAVQQVAQAVQAGHLDHRAVVSEEDEAAQLAGHFNAMLDRLAAREEAIKERETLLNETQKLGKIGGWQWDIEKHVLTWTQETYRIHDLTPDMIGESASSHIDRSAACYLPQDRKAILHAFWRCVEQGEPYDMEVPFISAKQRCLWIRTMAQAIIREGQVVKVFGYIMDITERKQLEIRLKAAAHYSRSLIEASLDPLVTISAEGKITDANKATELVTGVSHDKLIGSDFSDYFTDPGMACTGCQKAFSEGSVNNYPLAIRHVSGKVINVLYNASVYRDESGNILGLFAAARDITDLKKMQDEIQHLAFFDALTKLPNRRMFTDRLSLAMATSQRNGCFGALIYLDLDNFKPVNDCYGHAAGDLLLIDVANRLTSCVREVDTVGRTGGDEFVVILATLDADLAKAGTEAGEIAEKIRKALSQPYHLTIRQPGRNELKIAYRCTASIGLTLFHGHDASQEEVMRWADAAMYQAKEAGCDRVQFHPSGQQGLQLR